MTANEITSGLLIELPKRFPCRAWRRNVGATKMPSGQFVHFGVPGESDIQGIIWPGIFLAIEVKRGGDSMREQQKSFRDMITKHGGIALVARDVDTTLIAIRNAIDFKAAIHLATVKS